MKSHSTHRMPRGSPEAHPGDPAIGEGQLVQYLSWLKRFAWRTGTVVPVHIHIQVKEVQLRVADGVRSSRAGALWPCSIPAILPSLHRTGTFERASEAAVTTSEGTQDPQRPLLTLTVEDNLVATHTCGARSAVVHTRAAANSRFQDRHTINHNVRPTNKTQANTNLKPCWLATPNSVHGERNPTKDGERMATPRPSRNQKQWQRFSRELNENNKDLSNFRKGKSSFYTRTLTGLFCQR